MTEHNIAIIRGDGIGVDVIEEGLKALNAVAPRFGITFKFTEFPWGTDYYFKSGEMMPSDGLDTLSKFDAIYFGAVGTLTFKTTSH